MSATFDPTKHLRQLRGKGGAAEYLDVKWRLVWLRSEHPNASTVIEHIEIGPDIAIFRATVTIPEGGSATDYGSETPKDFGDFIEKAATKALGRALAQLGYGTQFVGEELDEGVRIVDSPVDRPQPTRAPARLSAPPAPRPAAAPTAAAGQPPNQEAVREAMAEQDFAQTPEGAIQRLQHAKTREEAEAARKACIAHHIEAREFGRIYTDTMNRLRVGYASAAG